MSSTLFIPSGRKMRFSRNSISGVPDAFSTMRPAMTYAVLLYWYWDPGGKSSGFFAHRSRILSAVVGCFMNGGT